MYSLDTRGRMKISLKKKGGWKFCFVFQNNPVLILPLWLRIGNCSLKSLRDVCLRWSNPCTVVDSTHACILLYCPIPAGCSYKVDMVTSKASSGTLLFYGGDDFFFCFGSMSSSTSGVKVIFDKSLLKQFLVIDKKNEIIIISSFFSLVFSPAIFLHSSDLQRPSFDCLALGTCVPLAPATRGICPPSHPSSADLTPWRLRPWPPRADGKSIEGMLGPTRASRG